MENKISDIANVIKRMDEQLRNDLLKKSERHQEKIMWDKKHKELKNKLNLDGNSISDHIRAMVYSLLSAERRFENIEDNKNKIDTIFYNYDPKLLKSELAANLEKQIRDISCGNRRLKYQMAALKSNIEKLEAFNSQSSSIDSYYKKYIKEDGSLKTLVQSLSQKENKLSEFGVPLVCEYLRNVGYDIPKPDRHIKRILGSKILACSKSEIVPDFEVFDIIAKISQKVGMSSAEVDYILWTYSADGYGAVCTVNSPKCDICVAKELCKKTKC